MDKIKTETNEITGDKVSIYKLQNGLTVYICKKAGMKSTLGMYGTQYGSIDNEFIESDTGRRVKVPSGIAHFLEHKLFEQEDGNALDLFAKIGVSSNAYTSFDHTVYFFETTNKVKESIEKLVELVTKPYFTVENVEKEKGIIAQELKMYEDEPESVVYYNTLKAMYVNHPLNVDIGGTTESILDITKEYLYTCYNTFYSQNNMFFIIIGDIDEGETISHINKLLNEKQRGNNSQKIVRYRDEEPKEISLSKIEKEMEIYMPYIALGFKLDPRTGIENIKADMISQIIYEACFSEMSDFYEKMYNNNILNETIELEYGYGNDYSYLILLGCSKNMDSYIKCLEEYIDDIKQKGVDNVQFELAKKKIIGKQITNSEESMNIARQMINSYILKTGVFDNVKLLNEITLDDINEFLRKNIKDDNRCTSIVISK